MSKAAQGGTGHPDAGSELETEETTGTGSTSTDTDDRPSITTDEVFEFLSNQRRRFTLHYLEYSDDEVDLGELSEYVASWENRTPVQEVDASERKRVYTSLQSHHLPKMEQQGIVEYDDRTGVVELAENAEDLDVYLEVVEDRDIPWSQYYLALAALNAALVAAAAVDVWPFGLLPDFAWGAFVVTTLLVSAVVHVYNDSVRRLGSTEKPPELRER